MKKKPSDGRKKVEAAGAERAVELKTAPPRYPTEEREIGGVRYTVTDYSQLFDEYNRALDAAPRR